MTIERLRPDALFDSTPFGFTQVVRADAGRMVYCAGQTAWDGQGQIVGAGDFAVQVSKSLENVGLALAAAGATPSDVVMMRVYIVDHDMEKLGIAADAFKAFFGPDHAPANTLLGVDKLAVPEFMIELEVQAIIE